MQTTINQKVTLHWHINTSITATQYISAGKENMAQVISMEDFTLMLIEMTHCLLLIFKVKVPEQRSEREIEMACLG